MSTVRLTGAILTHPRRLEMARALRASLTPNPVDIVVDPEPDGPPTALRTAMAAWSDVPATSTHHLILEDDALPSPGFLHQVELAATAAPGAAIAFYTNWQSRNGAAVRLGALAGARWTVAVDEYAPTVSIVLPADVGRGFPAFAQRSGTGWADDILMARYLRRHGVPLYLSVPNLVEQADAPSVDGHYAHILGRATCLSRGEPEGAWRLSDLLRPEVVPLLESGLAQGLRWQEPPVRWLPVRATRCLRRLGLPDDGWRESFDQATTRHRASPNDLDDRLGQPVATQLWQTAYLLGAEARRLRGADPLASVLDRWHSDEMVGQALATLGLAAICSGLSLTEAQRWWHPLADRVRESAAAGARDADESDRPRAGDHRQRSVMVLGDSRPLTRHLISDLTDRGFAVRTPGDGDPSLAADVDAVVAIGGADRSNPPANARPERARLVQVAVTAVRPDGCAEGVIPEPAEAASGRDNAATTVLDAGMPYGPGLGGDAYSPINQYVRWMLQDRRAAADVPHHDRFRPVHVWEITDAVAEVLEAPTPPARVPVDVDSDGAMTLARLIGAINGDPPLPVQPGVFNLGLGISTLALWLLYHSDY